MHLAAFLTSLPGPFEAAVKHDWVLLSLTHSHISLEETFRKLTTLDKRAA